MTELEALLKIADEASKRSDRWLFIAALIALVAVVIVGARYWAKRYEELISDHRIDRTNYQSSLKEIIGEQNKTSQTLAAVVERNTEVMRNCMEELRLNRKEK